ncbi:LPS assembly lipoprotein LptE [Rhizobium sp. TRM95111]|uniref:LPS assembly lipoprotein LptE n=1 Tax=Rhizobium alarense TaxID=2846851 RepID=UPI001F3C85D5|nr:LPS assembly lipoprotein LptE [Rhizobium alarense]MCF3639977.1 LPS assembly lipoprotein LptE [Rhizobium alarense]
MLSSDGFRPEAPRIASFLLAISLVLPGCQVRPLYSTGSGVEQALASVAISEADDRVEQRVRNELVFLLGGGRGEAADSRYRLDLNVTTRNIGVLIDTDTDAPRAGRIVVAADYNLTETGTGATIASGKRQTVALVDFPVQEFAKVRAIRDAENRAAKQLAEIVRAQVALALADR